jgi:hypothetical protein
VVLGDTVDIGSATTGVRVTTAGAISDIDGDLSITSNVDTSSGLDVTGANLTVGGANFTVTPGSGNITTAGTFSLPNSNSLTGVANYIQANNGLSVGGGTTYYFNSSGNINALAGTFAGTLDANGQVDLGDGGDAIAISGTTVSLTSNSATNDITLTSADDIVFNDLQLGSAIQITDIDNSLPNSNTGIVDAINDAYNAAVGSGGGIWNRTAGYIYPTNVADNVGIGTQNTAEIISKLYVTNDSTLTGKALAIFNQEESQDILTASASGTTMMTLGNTGNLVIEGSIADLSGDTLTVSDNLTVSGTTGLTLSGAGGQITFANGETIDNDVNGTINIGAATLQVTGGTGIVSDQATVALLNANTTTINFGSAATTMNIADAAITGTIDIGGVTADGTTTINIATEGTSADTIAIGNSNASTTLALTGGDDWNMSATGILTMSASAAQTTAIVATDTDYTNALSVDSNHIIGTTANIDLTNFDVTGSTGNITTAGDLAVNGGDITTTATTWNFDLPASGGTINFRDGTNNLFSITDAGDYGVLAMNTNASAPGTCTEGEIYADDNGNIYYCESANTWTDLTPGGGGGVTAGGTPVAGQVAYWTDSGTIAGNSDLWWDNTNEFLGIGLAGSPVHKLDVSGTVVGKALVSFNDTGTDQNILTASASGTTVMNLDRSGNLSFINQADARFYDSDGSNYTGFQAPGNLTSDVLYTLPTGTFTADYVLTWQTGDVMEWKEVTGVGGTGDITYVGNVASGDAFTQSDAGYQLWFEGSSADDFEVLLTSEDPGADYTVTLPARTGNVALINPDAVQPAAGATSVLWFNETNGGTPNLVELEVGGTDTFVVQNDGDIVTVGDIAINGGNITSSADLDIDATGDDVTTPDRLTVGTSTPGVGQFNVSGTQVGKALAIFNDTGTDQNIITASASGTTVFSLDRAGDLNLANSEYIANSTDDIIAFVGSGGGDDTNLYLNLDGTYPTLYSNTDSQIGIDDDLIFVGAQSITTSTGNLTIAPAGNLVINTTGGTINIDDAIIDLSTQATNIDLINSNASALTFETNLLRLDTSNTAVEVTGTTNLGDGGSTNYAQFNTTGDLTFVGTANTITGPGANGLTLTNTSGQIQLTTVTSGEIDITSAGALDMNAASATLDTSGAFSFDAGASSNVSVTSGDLTLSTVTSGELDLTSAGLIDINAGANLDIDVTGTYDMLSTGAFSIDGTGASNVSASSGNLTLSTLTSGTLILNSAGAMDIDSAGALTIDTAGSGDITITSADDIIFNDTQIGGVIQVSDADGSFTSGDTGIIDAINTAYAAATGGSGSVWTLSSNTIYPTTLGDRVGIGTTTSGDIESKLFVTSGAGQLTGKALAIFDQEESQDILTASASGTTRLRVANNGNLFITGTLNTVSGNLTLDSSGGTTTISDNLIITGTSDLRGNISNSTGNIILADTTDIGSSTTGIRVTTAGAISDIDGNLAINDNTDLTGNLDVSGTLISGTGNAFQVDGTGNISSSGTTGVTLSGADADLTFSGSGNHDITASSGTLRLGAATLTGTITGGSQDIDALGSLDFGAGNVNITTTNIGLTTDTDLLTLAANVLTIAGDIRLGDTYTLEVGGLTGIAYNAFANAVDAPEEGAISSDNDLYIGGDLEVDGTIYSTSVTGNYTQGSVIFAGASGLLTEDNTNFFWDDTNDLFGIGDNTPSHLLDISGSYAGNALVSLNETLGNDILTASAGGTTRTRITNAGNLIITGTLNTVSGNLTIDSAGGTTTISDTTILGSAVTGLNITTAGVLSDIDGNLVLADTIDLGSASTGINVTTAGVISDTDGNLVLSDTVDLGSATTGLRISTDGVILDIDDAAVSITDDLSLSGDLTVTGGDINGPSGENIDLGEATANTITLYIASSGELSLDASYLYPFTDSGLSLGSAANQFADLYLDGGNINLYSATDIDILDNSATSLTISEASNNYLTISTLNDSEHMEFGNTSLANLTYEFAGLDCSGYQNGGVLTTDASGNLICATDDGGTGGGGNVNSSGSPASGQTAFWTGTSYISGNNDFYWNNTDELLGIGLAGSPVHKLDVSGQCVTGDSELITKDGQILKVEDVKGGEKVYSLDQETGKLVPAKITALLDMGVKPIFKLETEDGKSIRTTGNHPYLTQDGWKKVIYLKEGQEIAVAARNPLALRLDEKQPESNPSQNSRQNINSSFNGHNFSSLSQQSKIHINSQQACHNQANCISESDIVGNHFFPSVNNTASFNENKQATIAINEARKRKIPSAGVNSGAIIPAENQATAKLVKNSEYTPRSPLNFTIDIDRSYFKTSSTDSVLSAFGELVACGFETTCNHFITKELSDVKQCPTATEGLVLGFEKIISIEYIGEEQVWDLSIEGTHNFVANGIIAHNTTGKALMALNETGDQDILTASASGTTVLRIANNGDLILASGGTLEVGGASGVAYNIISDSGGSATHASTDDDLYIEDILEVGNTLYVGGNQVGSDALWANTLNVYHPLDEYASVADLAIGGTSTSSAKFWASATTGEVKIGATASSASTTEGAMYYDSDDDQLKVYANGKWQSDRTTATVIVGTNNGGGASRNYEKADYVCDGTNDEVQIEAAIAALPSTGGVVALLDGTFNIQSDIDITKSNVSLIGVGKATILKRMYDETGDAAFIVIGNGSTSYEGIHISQLMVDGNNGSYSYISNQGIQITANADRTSITNIWVYNTQRHAIWVKSDYNKIEGNFLIETSGTMAGGVYVEGSYNLVSNNYIDSVSYGLQSVNSGHDYNTFVGNYLRAINSYAIQIYQSDNNNITGNIIIDGGTSAAIYIRDSSDQNLVSGNKIHNTGGDAISINDDSDNNSIVSNDITDTNSDAIAIDIESADCQNNYLAANRYSTSTGSINITDSGTGTIYGAQLADSGADLILKPSGGVGIGITDAVGLLTVDSTDVDTLGKALAIFNQDENQAILTASASGTTRFTLDYDGSITQTSADTTGDAYTFTADSITTGTGMAMSIDGLTTGYGIDIASTSTALTTGRLLSLDWSPGSSTTATGDLFRLNIGANGNVTNLLNITDNGSTLFRVAETQIESAVPHTFSAVGDVSIAYDLVFTNQTAATIDSYGPLTVRAGESFENNNLTLSTYGTGDIVFDLSGTGSLLAQGTDPSLIFDVTTATDTDFWLGVQDDAAGDDNDKFQIGDGTVPGTNPFVTIDTSGNVGIGQTTPTAKLEVEIGSSDAVTGLLIDQDDLDQIGLQIVQAANATANALDISSLQVSGNVLDIDWSTAETQTGALAGINLDFTNLTADGANALYGLHINDHVGATASTEYAIYQQGTNWDYGAYFTDDVYMTGRLDIINSTTDLSGKSALIVDQNESEDIFTASASGTTRFTLGRTGTIDLSSAATSGDIVDIDWAGSTTLTAAMSGLDIDLTNVTADASNAAYGIHVNDLAATTASTEIGIYQQGTNFDIGIQAEAGIAIGSQQTLAVDDTTPTVTGGSHFITANTGGTLISDFDDGHAGQLLFIEINDADTDFDCTSSGLDCGSTNITIPAAGDLFSWIHDGTQWKLIGWMDQSNDYSGAGGADLAEYFPSNDTLEPGEVVKVDPENSEHVIRSASAYESSVVGIVSSDPGITLGWESDFNSYPVALAGRVPVAISASSEAIIPGDYITTSTEAGLAMKANAQGRVVGQALEAWDPESGKDEIIVFINNTWYDPGLPAQAGLALNDIGELNIEKVVQVEQVEQADLFQLTDSNGNIVDKLAAFSEAIIANIKIGYAEVASLVAPSIRTNEISPIDGDLVLNLNHQLSTIDPASSESGFAKLLIKAGEEVVAEIDSEGNATFSGELASSELRVTGSASIAGELHAGKLYVDEIVQRHPGGSETTDRIPLEEDSTVSLQNDTSGFGKLLIKAGEEIVAEIDSEGNATFSGELKAESLKSQDASIAGELRAGKIYADEIISPISQTSPTSISLEQIEALLAEAESDQDILTETQGWLDADSKPINLNELALENLYVTDTAVLNSITISNSIVVGSDLVISSHPGGSETTDGIPDGDSIASLQNDIGMTSIDTLSAPLSIQSSATQPLHLMAGLVSIDTDGNVQITGNLNVAGQVAASGLTLHHPGGSETTDRISSGGDSIAALQNDTSGFGKLLALYNEAGEEVAGISATGSAHFNEVATDKLIITSGTSAGTAKILEGASEAVIRNPNITENNLVFVTPTTSTGNYTLYIKEQKEGEIIVGFDSPVEFEVEFNWWLVQLSEKAE